MKKLIITGVGALKTEKARKDGKKSRMFYTIYFADKDNQLTNTSQRNIFQEHNADGKECFWSGADYNKAKSLIGTEVSGEIVRKEVQPYAIGNDGRMATSWTGVVLEGEYVGTIVKQAGHLLPGEVAASVDAEAATAKSGLTA